MRIELRGSFDQEIIDLADATARSLDEFWEKKLRDKYNQSYYAPKVVLFDWMTTTGCGLGIRLFGPFFCSGDNTVYVDPKWFESLEKDYGAKVSPFVIAYIIAHEFGHAIQTMRGTFHRIFSKGGPDSIRVRGELQCDYFAGTWIRHVMKDLDFPWDVIEQDIYDCLYTATKVGDDAVQSWKNGGVIDESKFGHGSSEHRAGWLYAGIKDEDPFKRDVFEVLDLDSY